MRPRLGRTAIVGQALLALAFVAVVLRAEGVRLGGPDTFDVHVAFADASGLRDDARAPVTVAGVPEGRVVDVRYDPARGRAVATLRLDRRVRGVIHADATATIVPRSALQDLTVELSAGSRRSPALRPGAWIDPARATGAVALDRLVDVLDADTRVQAQVVLSQLAVGLRGRSGVLRDAVARLNTALDPARAVTRALAARPAALTRLVGALGAIGSALGDRDAALGGALDAGRRTLRVTAGRRRALGATVRELEPALGALDGALRSTRRASGPLAAALDRLAPTAAALPGALAAARVAAPELLALVRETRALAAGGGVALADARRVASAAGPTARTLTPALRDGRSVLAAVDRRRDSIGLLGERFSGVLSTNDANGTILRGLGFFEPFDPADVGEPGATGVRLTTLKVQAARALTRTCLHVNPVACLVRYLVPGLPGAVRPGLSPVPLREGRR